MLRVMGFLGSMTEQEEVRKGKCLAFSGTADEVVWVSKYFVCVVCVVCMCVC